MEHYDSRILLDKDVISDVFKHLGSDTKLLVFGLGYDSKMWYYGSNKNTYFVEDDPKYIDMSKDIIPITNIIKYKYNTRLSTIKSLSDEQIKAFIPPDELTKLSPFDVIIIDGPKGYQEHPGRLIPSYWATLLTKHGSIIYMDDSNREIEAYCISKFFKNNKMEIFKKRFDCTKIYV